VITKEEIVDSIAGLLGVTPPRISTGSTEPREIFDLTNVVLGLGLSSNLTKPELARAIVEASGECWNADFESRGGTVTRDGLLAVHRAVAYFVEI
jgi:hypothetical protein